VKTDRKSLRLPDGLHAGMGSLRLAGMSGDMKRSPWTKALQTGRSWMSCKVATALVALLVFCLAPVVLPGAGNRASHHAFVVKRPAPTMSDRPTEAVNDAARTFTTDEKEAFAASRLVPCARASRGARAGRTKPWIKLTAPGGEPVHVNVEQIASVRPDTEMPGANTQLDLASAKFQRVRESVDQVMQLISGTSEAQENDDRPSAALVCAG